MSKRKNNNNVNSENPSVRQNAGINENNFNFAQTSNAEFARDFEECCDVEFANEFEESRNNNSRNLEMAREFNTNNSNSRSKNNNNNNNNSNSRSKNNNNNNN